MSNLILTALLPWLVSQSAFGLQMYAFDWDGNLAHTPSKIVLFSKTDQREIIISGEEFARDRKLLEERYLGFEVRSNRQYPELSSFRYTDALDQNYFVNGLKDAKIDAVQSSWQAKQWPRFKAALANPRTRSLVSIITSRGHSPSHFMDGLEILKSLGWLEHLPDLQNIHPVAYKFGSVAHLDNVAAKVAIIDRQLDQLSADQSDPRHYYEFSDDADFYVDAVKEHVRKEKIAGRWPNVDVVVVKTSGLTDTAWLIEEKEILLDNTRDQRFRCDVILGALARY